MIEGSRPDELSSRILLSGGSGLLGASIAAALSPSSTDGPTQATHSPQILQLVRRAPRKDDEIQWNTDAPDGGFTLADLAKLEGLSAAIHLSGANVAARRWTASYKEEIASSRIQTTALLSRTLSRLSKPPAVLVSASAIGYYGDRGDEVLDESSKPGTGFFPELCTAWERATLPAANAGIRVIHPRFGMVLSRKGGAMAQLKGLFKLGLGGNLGDGKQWMSWVSESDAVAAVLFALNQSLGEPPSKSQIPGAFNVTSPDPVTNADFTKIFARSVARPAFLNAPAFALRIAFGEMANEALLASTRAIPTSLLNAGFTFKHPTLASALQSILR